MLSRNVCTITDLRLCRLLCSCVYARRSRKLLETDFFARAEPRVRPRVSPQGEWRSRVEWGGSVAGVVRRGQAWQG